MRPYTSVTLLSGTICETKYVKRHTYEVENFLYILFFTFCTLSFREGGLLIHTLNFIFLLLSFKKDFLVRAYEWGKWTKSDNISSRRRIIAVCVSLYKWPRKRENFHCKDYNMKPRFLLSNTVFIFVNFLTSAFREFWVLVVLPDFLKSLLCKYYDIESVKWVYPSIDRQDDEE